MKKYIIHAVVALITTMLASCSDELDNNSNVPMSQSQEQEGKVIIQPRSPSLPKIKSLKLDKVQSRSIRSGETGNSDVFLGRAYKVKEGNYILGDFSNVSNPVINIAAVKEYDPTYINGIRLNTIETTSFSYGTFNRYQYNSTLTKKVTSGFNLNFKIFSIGKKKTTTEVFKTVIDNTEQATYGELSINFTNNQYTLQNSEATRKLFARQFLTKSFIRGLYNSPISSTLASYGDFVLTGYLTGGKAYATFAGTTKKTMDYKSKEKDMEKSISASLTYKGSSASGNLGFTGANHNSKTFTFNGENTYVYIKTFGGIRDGSEGFVKARVLGDLNIDLTSWMRSLNDASNHTMIDVVDNSLYPLSNFVLEKNFKQRLDDTFNDVLPTFENLVYP